MKKQIFTAILMMGLSTSANAFNPSVPGRQIDPESILPSGDPEPILNVEGEGEAKRLNDERFDPAKTNAQKDTAIQEYLKDEAAQKARDKERADLSKLIDKQIAAQDAARERKNQEVIAAAVKARKEQEAARKKLLLQQKKQAAAAAAAQRAQDAFVRKLLADAEKERKKQLADAAREAAAQAAADKANTGGGGCYYDPVTHHPACS